MGIFCIKQKPGVVGSSKVESFPVNESIFPLSVLRKALSHLFVYISQKKILQKFQKSPLSR